MKADVRKYDKLISKKKEEIQKYQTRKLNLYDDYKDGILDKQEYMMFKSDYDKKLENCENEVASYETDKDMILVSHRQSILSTRMLMEVKIQKERCRMKSKDISTEWIGKEHSIRQ